MRYPHHISIIPQFNTTDRHLRNKRHFHRPLRGGDKGKENGSPLAFSDLSVSCEWPLECQDFSLPFSHQISPFLSFFSFFLFFFNLFIIPSSGSGSWTWYAKLPVVSVLPLAMHCKLVNSTNPSEGFASPLSLTSLFLGSGGTKDAFWSWGA